MAAFFQRHKNAFELSPSHPNPLFFFLFFPQQIVISCVGNKRGKYLTSLEQPKKGKKVFFNYLARNIHKIHKKLTFKS